MKKITLLTQHTFSFFLNLRATISTILSKTIFVAFLQLKQVKEEFFLVLMEVTINGQIVPKKEDDKLVVSLL